MGLVFRRIWGKSPESGKSGARAWGERAAMNGAGRYEWIGTDGVRRSAKSWNDIPAAIDSLIAFVPEYPEGPHTDEEHEYMESFDAKLKEVMNRCQR